MAYDKRTLTIVGKSVDCSFTLKTGVVVSSNQGVRTNVSARVINQHSKEHMDIETTTTRTQYCEFRVKLSNGEIVDLEFDNFKALKGDFVTLLMLEGKQSIWYAGAYNHINKDVTAGGSIDKGCWQDMQWPKMNGLSILPRTVIAGLLSYAFATKSEEFIGILGAVAWLIIELTVIYPRLMARAHQEFLDELKNQFINSVRKKMHEINQDIKRIEVHA